MIYENSVFCRKYISSVLKIPNVNAECGNNICFLLDAVNAVWGSNICFL
jgi:hypothetical protein